MYEFLEEGLAHGKHAVCVSYDCLKYDEFLECPSLPFNRSKK